MDSRCSTTHPRDNDEVSDIGLEAFYKASVNTTGSRDDNDMMTPQSLETFLRLVGVVGGENQLPSSTRFLAYQQKYQRFQFQRQQMTASQIQEQSRLLQQRPMMQLQQEQLQHHQQNPVVLNVFLDIISSLNSYQQLSSDQTRNELSTMFNYGDQSNGYDPFIH
ncbi:hypothetical protein B0O80DRAFT_525174 [Mortierella sp. GBAus27b]|nr:hypothetical protein B0O80DRAFT_525174 [Mortierella sp. GBAus27b]